MKRIGVLAVACGAALLVAACGAPDPTGSAQAASIVAAAPAASGGLNESYTDALPIATQLILGSLEAR